MKTVESICHIYTLHYIFNSVRPPTIDKIKECSKTTPPEQNKLFSYRKDCGKYRRRNKEQVKNVKDNEKFQREKQKILTTNDLYLQVDFVSYSTSFARKGVGIIKIYEMFSSSLDALLSFKITYFPSCNETMIEKILSIFSVRNRREGVVGTR